jgi:hypothetical protein
MNNHIIDDDKQIRYCKYCNKRLRPIDYSFFEFGFDLDGKKYYGCRNCSALSFFHETQNNKSL